MRTILFYDCFAGISGDMNLAAMIDLGVDPDYLRAELSKLGMDHEFELRVSAGSRRGIHGTQVEVVLRGATEHGHHHDHGHHDHPHGHDHHGHGHHDHDHDHDHHDHGVPAAQTERHAHRNLRDIAALIESSGLDRAVKDTSLAIFRRVAEAEAKVHGSTPEEVHFHEVGAVDSIVDIVGAAICRHALGVDEIWSAPPELGGGFSHCCHGLMPVPAPATVEILKGVPTTRGTTQHEATTPTGAAILAVLADRFVEAPRLILERTAYGIGHRDPEIPNVLRVHLARPAAEAGAPQHQQARLLQCNIDDMTAEMLGVVMDTLMQSGAMDVHFTPILMKKSRPATCLSVLCAPADEARFKELIFRHTTTLGIKSIPLEKTALETRFEHVHTSMGPVTMKQAMWEGAVLRQKPELEECREMARRWGIPLLEVYARIAGKGN